MMKALSSTKRCGACGQTKDRSEFYVSKKRPSGRHRLMSRCKACIRRKMADRKRKGEGEYRTLEQVKQEAEIRNRPLREARERRKTEKAAYRASEAGLWAAAIRKAAARESERSVGARARRADPWLRKAQTIVRSLRHRKTNHRPSGKPKSVQHQTWHAAIGEAMGRARSRIRQRVAYRDAWRRIMATKTRNWNRKHEANRNRKKPSRIAREAALQVCFDWEDSDA